MGLDIAVYTDLEFVRSEPVTDSDYEDYIHIFVNPDFPASRAAPLKTGFYEGVDVMGFRAGSYGSYNRWREKLSQLVLGVEPRLVWVNEAEFKHMPLFELIHFSDCEGVIGSEAAARLAGHFAAYEGEARDNDDPYGSFFEIYQNFSKAFDLAATGGAMVFC
jgi:hypothetical protein